MTIDWLGSRFSKICPKKDILKKSTNFEGTMVAKRTLSREFAAIVPSKFVDFIRISFLGHIFESRDPQQSIVIVKIHHMTI